MFYLTLHSSLTAFRHVRFQPFLVFDHVTSDRKGRGLEAVTFFNRINYGTDKLHDVTSIKTEKYERNCNGWIFHPMLLDGFPSWTRLSRGLYSAYFTFNNF